MITVGSETPLIIGCTKCGQALEIIGVDTAGMAVVDAGNLRPYLAHGLMCGKSSDEIQRMRDALGTVRDALVRGHQPPEVTP